VDPRPMDLKQLPRIAHASAEDAPAPLPTTFTAVRNHEFHIQPYGGTWCAPVTAVSAEGAPIKTTWTEYCEIQKKQVGRSEYDGKYEKLIELEPLPEARIYLIDTVDGLDWLVAKHPLPDEHQNHGLFPDWEGLARSGWDAVYVSEAGLRATADRVPIGRPWVPTVRPSLGRWDCSSFLWLRENYRLTIR
jgi:hypothetical protein